jgi:hypothetical protein
MVSKSAAVLRVGMGRMRVVRGSDIGSLYGEVAVGTILTVARGLVRARCESLA